MDRFPEGFQDPRQPSKEIYGQPDSTNAENREKSAPTLEEDVADWHRQMLTAGLVRPKSTLLARRTFLVGAAAAGAATFDWANRMSPLAKFLDDTIYGQYDYDKIVMETKRILKEQYDVDLLVGLDQTPSVLKGDPATLERYRNTLRYLAEEISKYPPEMIRSVGEARGFQIRVADSLHMEVKDAFSTRKAFIAAGGAAPPLRTGKPAQFMLDAGYDEFFQRKTIHHELNHRFSEKWQDMEERNKKWISFHGAVSARPYQPKPDNISSSAVPPERYFFNYHARSAPIEDEATCAEWMMTPDYIVEFIERWKKEKDPAVKNILALKYIETKNNYAKWSEGKIGEEFWKRMINEGMRRKGLPLP